MSVTPASQLSALVSHAHHKMLVVVRCAQTTRVERGMRRGGQLVNWVKGGHALVLGDRLTSSSFYRLVQCLSTVVAHGRPITDHYHLTKIVR